MLLPDHNTRESNLVSGNLLMSTREKCCTSDLRTYDPIFSRHESSPTTPTRTLRKTDISMLQCFERIEHSRNVENSFSIDHREFLESLDLGLCE